MWIEIKSSEMVCSNCKHFHQHYVKSGGYFPCNAGHCGYPRLKNRKPGQTGCEYFESD